MKRNGLLLLALCGSLSAACNDENPKNATYPMHKCGDVDITSAHCVEIPAGDVNAFLTATNSLAADTTLVLGKGTYAMTNEVNVQNVADVHIVGQGIDQTILDWDGVTAQVNGIAALNTNGFVVQDFTVANSVKDGIRVEASDRVTYRRIKATWKDGADSTNGAYGIYPVKSKHVLVEDSVAEHASDAGLYVGQCQYVIVRNNEVYANVAGLEIENTEYADVYANDVHDNTGGLVIFDLPGNPIVGRDIRVHDNHVHDNNGINFAPGGTVQSIPVGTGTFAMASRRLEILNNTYERNDTVDIGIVSGLVIQSDQSKWNLDPTATGFVGTVTDLNLLPGFNADGSPSSNPNLVSNFRSENIRIAGNSHSGSGTSPDLTNTILPVGALLVGLYSPLGKPVDSVVYDTIGEPIIVDSAGPPVVSHTDLTTNVNNICAGGNTMGSFASLNFYFQDMTSGASPYVRWDAPPFGPAAGQQFDCTAPAVITAAPLVLWPGN